MIPALACHHPGVSERRTPRQLAREATVARIKEIALAQLAVEGAAGLSLRAIARELDLVSSALYRYFASRDQLVTALVLDAYGDLADAIETSVEVARHDGERRAWIAGAVALRQWALCQPHRYALLYGSPIPGYEAPAATIEPAGRVVRALVRPGLRTPAPDTAGRPIEPELLTQLATARTGLGLPDGTGEGRLLCLVAAVAQVHGLVALELNGQFLGGFAPADRLFDAVVTEAADRLGLS